MQLPNRNEHLRTATDRSKRGNIMSANNITIKIATIATPFDLYCSEHKVAKGTARKMLHDGRLTAMPRNKANDNIMINLVAETVKAVESANLKNVVIVVG